MTSTSSTKDETDGTRMSSDSAPEPHHSGIRAAALKLEGIHEALDAVRNEKTKAVLLERLEATQKELDDAIADVGASSHPRRIDAPTDDLRPPPGGGVAAPPPPPPPPLPSTTTTTTKTTKTTTTTRTTATTEKGG